jgi:hypothetical protein
MAIPQILFGKSKQSSTFTTKFNLEDRHELDKCQLLCFKSTGAFCAPILLRTLTQTTGADLLNFETGQFFSAWSTVFSANLLSQPARLLCYLLSELTYYHLENRSRTFWGK